MDHSQRTVVSSYRRRKRRRATITLSLVGLVMVGTFTYAAAYFQGWVAAAPPSSLASPPPCQAADAADAAVALTPGAVTVNVYNATNRDGLARSVAKSLRTQGFNIGEIANDPLGKRIVGVGEVRHGQLGTADANLVAKQLPGAKVVLEKRTDDSVDLVLGNRFSALRAPAGVVQTHATKPTTPPTPRC
jgi:LytR cell envelope-related transcriptional attenuator